MLTKDLIRTRTYKGELKPQFIDPSEPSLIDLAAELIRLYDAEMGASRTEISEGVMGLVNSSRDIKLAKGLNKLMLDRCEFSHGGDYNHREFRRELFTQSAELLKTPRSFSDFRREMENRFSDQQDQLEDIYGDHPECELLVQCKAITPAGLLMRYNTALVQSLLIQSSSVEITLEEPDSAKLRRLFHYIKFFRLLADVRYNPMRKDRLLITVAGPGKMLENVSKYGLQLASFFPALLQMARWEMSAIVNYNRKEFPLILDHSCGLKSHYQNFSAYVPEEIRIFRKEFEKKSNEWKVSDRAPFIKLTDGSLIFPDLFFRHSSGRVIALELFHRWHETPLLARISKEELLKKSDLILGIDRSVARKKHIEEALNESDYCTDRSFQFNDFPAITVVTKLLNSLL